MNLREAAEAALKAMVSFESGTNGLYEGEFAEEIAVLKAALAEPTGKQDLQVEPELADQLLEDQIVYGTAILQGGKRVDPMSIYKDLEKRMPLSEEQLKRIDAGTMFHESPDWSVRFARAVERAHGIGGSDELDIAASRTILDAAILEEREACAKVCERMWHSWLDSPEDGEPNKPDAEDCYRAIRARSNP